MFEVVPAEFVAEILKEVADNRPVGVPEITHVATFIERPDGRAGDDVQFVIAAPFSKS